jgi:F420-dependent oxidoreductase-like protein
MELRIMTEPQEGATYDDLLAVATESERLGFGAFFRSDHYQRIHPGDPGPGPTDAWITLAGLARDTSTIRLGTMVTSATFRLPGPLAIAVATVDAMSGGRVDIGLGAGWYDGEHESYGIPFPPTKERFDRLEEQLEILTGMWATPAGETFAHDGEHYRVDHSPALPKPVQSPRPPVIIGGHGPTRTPSLAARFGDEFNVPFSPVADVAAQFGRVRQACEAHGRDPETLTWSACVTVAVGADDAQVDRRCAAIGQDAGHLRAHGGAGTPEQFVARVGEFAEAGCQRLYLQVLDLSDLDHLRLIASEVLPHV